jgi:hypothetical protein
VKTAPVSSWRYAGKKSDRRVLRRRDETRIEENEDYIKRTSKGRLNVSLSHQPRI